MTDAMLADPLEDASVVAPVQRTDGLRLRRRAVDRAVLADALILQVDPQLEPTGRHEQLRVRHLAAILS